MNRYEWLYGSIWTYVHMCVYRPDEMRGKVLIKCWDIDIEDLYKMDGFLGIWALTKFGPLLLVWLQT